jgi:Holliday junction resolvasome RuvABC endonuclease subunit
MSKKILGLDVSSTTIGICVLEIDDKNKINFVKCDYIKPSKKGSILDRLLDTRIKLQAIIDKEKPDYIGIEDFIVFMKKSTATTLATLSAFNRMSGLLAFDHLGSHPGMFNVMTIRHGLKLSQALPKKEDMPELVAKHLGITFPYAKDKKGKIKEESFDMADSVAVALYYAFVLTGKIKRKGKKK